MWEELTLIGEVGWLLASIAAGTCIAVTDGSYMREIYPDLGAAAFVVECTKGRGRILGSFPESSVEASAFRSELLGLLALHLLLLAANKVRPGLGGLAHIFSDCLGALGRVIDLPADRIPAACKHGDILKILMMHCTELSFVCRYSHVLAHQDDTELVTRLGRPA